MFSAISNGQKFIKNFLVMLRSSFLAFEVTFFSF